MAATIEDIMTAIEERLDTVPGLRTTNFAPGSPVYPAAFPLVPSFDYATVMKRGSYMLPFRIAVIVSAALDRVGQHKLASFANQTGGSSIRAALEADKTLGGVVSELVVDSFDSHGLGEVGLIDFFGGVVNVRIWATGV